MNGLITALVSSALSVSAAGATLTDVGAARARIRVTTILVEASGPSPHGRDTAILAESESSGGTSGQRDNALLAEASGPSPGTRDTALA